MNPVLCVFFEKGYSVSVVLPTKAKNYLRSLGNKSKNDTIDARGLAQMGAQQCLPVWSPIGKFFYELRSLTRHHQSLQEAFQEISFMPLKTACTLPRQLKNSWKA